jgi:uncharacterized protein (TIRG00374 family)
MQPSRPARPGDPRVGAWRKQVLHGALGGVVAAVFLILLFRGTRWSELFDAIRSVHPGWLLLAQVLLWCSCFARTQRWAYVVRAVQPASFRSLFSATQIGFLLNFAVPARLGELVRAYVLARLERLPVSRSMAMVALDRVNDVIGLLVVMMVASLALARGREAVIPTGSFGNTEPIVLSSSVVQPAALAFAALVAGSLLGLALLYARQKQIVGLVRAILDPVSPRVAARASHLLIGFAEGMHILRSGPDAVRAIAWSLVTWAADVASVAAVLVAFDLSFPWYTPFVMIAVIGIVIFVPVTPGFVGQYHVPAVAGLLMAAPAVDPVTAKAVAIVDHLWTLVPVTVLGLYCMRRERLGLREIIRRSSPGAGEQAVSRPAAD